MPRIAVLDKELCKPSKCGLECLRFCPLVRTGVKAIEFKENMKRPVIHENLCIGCGICVKKCPFKAITIVNLPAELEGECVHRYGVNAFRLYGLPIPKPRLVTGVIGKNGTGKTTSLKILSGKLKPNLGDLSREASWDEIIRFFRGSELQTYFKKLSEGKLRVVHKIQYVDLIPRYVKGTVSSLIEKADERGLVDCLKEDLGLVKIWDRDIKMLSGGELQRFIIATVLCKDADLYLFDEPSSYLDAYERVRIAKAIRRYTVGDNRMCIVVEHDLAVLDYISDHICIIFGEPGVYGIVSNPYGTGTGINHFLEGFLPDLNMRIRSEPIRFRLKPPSTPRTVEQPLLEWSNLEKKLGEFHLTVSEGCIHEGEVIGVVGPNGIGKTTFVRMLSGEISPDSGEVSEKTIKISYKPQYVSSKYSEDLTVRDVLMRASKDAISTSSWFFQEIVVKLRLDRLLDRRIGDLSGGELQKIAIAECLATQADLYLLDEPSAYLDVEERLAVATSIRRVMETRKAAALVVEHDVIIVDFISDSLMVFRGDPGVRGHATSPLELKNGMNIFLADLQITFRRDVRSGRPRINKEGSYLDRYQKRIGEYYYVELGK